MTSTCRRLFAPIAPIGPGCSTQAATSRQKPPRAPVAPVETGRYAQAYPLASPTGSSLILGQILGQAGGANR